jgi:hypothetical protein
MKQCRHASTRFCRGAQTSRTQKNFFRVDYFRVTRHPSTTPAGSNFQTPVLAQSHPINCIDEATRDGMGLFIGLRIRHSAAMVMSPLSLVRRLRERGIALARFTREAQVLAALNHPNTGCGVRDRVASSFNPAESIARVSLVARIY